MARETLPGPQPPIASNSTPADSTIGYPQPSIALTAPAEGSTVVGPDLAHRPTDIFVDADSDADGASDIATSHAPFAVLFDSDGIVVDSEGISLATFCKATEELSGLSLTDDEVEEFCGLRDSEIVSRIHARHNVRMDEAEFRDLKARRYREAAEREGVEPFAGVVDLLEELREQRIPFALASSGSRWKIELNLAAAKLTRHFDIIVSGEEVRRGKPEPDVFLEAARRLGMPPERCVVIEDSIHGVSAGRAAGMAVLAVTNTFERHRLRSADRIVSSLETVGVDLLGRLALEHEIAAGPHAGHHPNELPAAPQTASAVQPAKVRVSTALN